MNPETLRPCALMLHVCVHLVEDVSLMRESGKSSFTQITHKEETKTRISADKCDRQGLQIRRDMCGNPLASDDHQDSMINIVTGRMAPPSVSSMTQ